MAKNEIYRDLYSKELGGLRWDLKKYEVHHINANHKDNRIENLVLLPSVLHKKLHMYHQMVTSEEYLAKCFDISPLSNLDGLIFTSLALSARKFFLVKQEEMRFVKLRDFILNSAWANLDFSHDFEKYVKLYDLDLYKKYVEVGKNE